MGINFKNPLGHWTTPMYQRFSNWAISKDLFMFCELDELFFLRSLIHTKNWEGSDDIFHLICPEKRVQGPYHFLKITTSLINQGPCQRKNYGCRFYDKLQKSENTVSAQMERRRSIKIWDFIATALWSFWQNLAHEYCNF